MKIEDTTVQRYSVGTTVNKADNVQSVFPSNTTMREPEHSNFSLLLQRLLIPWIKMEVFGATSLMACKLWYADVQTVDFQASFPSSHMAGMSLHSHPRSTGSCDYHVCGRNSHLELEACVGLQSNSYLNS